MSFSHIFSCGAGDFYYGNSSYPAWVGLTQEGRFHTWGYCPAQNIGLDGEMLIAGADNGELPTGTGFDRNDVAAWQYAHVWRSRGWP